MEKFPNLIERGYVLSAQCPSREILQLQKFVEI